MELLHLDVRTLAFVSALGGALMAVTMAGIYAAGMRERALLDWAGSGLGYFAGYAIAVVFLGTPGVLPGWMVVALANALIGAAHALVLLGVQRHLDRPRWPWTMAVMVFLIFAVMFVFPELRTSLRARIIAISGFYIAVDAIAAVMLWRDRAKGLTPYRRALAAVLLVFAGFLTMRFGYAVFSHVLTTPFVQDPFQGAAFLINMIFCFVLSVSLALLMFRQKEIELRRMARRDALTGLYNRRTLDELAEREQRRSDRYGTPLAVVMLDIDRFKAINDLHGHSAGDEVLRSVADNVIASMRVTDMAFRIGGEEFLMLLPGTDCGDAFLAAERLRERIQATPVGTPSGLLTVTASFGVACYQSGAESWDEAMRRADRALYQAKRQGRNRVGGERPRLKLASGSAAVAEPGG